MKRSQIDRKQRLKGLMCCRKQVQTALFVQPAKYAVKKGVILNRKSDIFS